MVDPMLFFFLLTTELPKLRLAFNDLCLPLNHGSCSLSTWSVVVFYSVGANHKLFPLHLWQTNPYNLRLRFTAQTSNTLAARFFFFFYLIRNPLFRTRIHRRTKWHISHDNTETLGVHQGVPISSISVEILFVVPFSAMTRPAVREAHRWRLLV